MNLTVHIIDNSDRDFINHLKSLIHENISLTCGPVSSSSEEFQVLVSGVPEKSDLDASPELHTLIIPWSGLPRATGKLMLDYPLIAVHNLHYNSKVVAEMALSLMFCALKKVLPIDRKLRQGDWTPRYEASRSLLLSGKSVLILGYGAIGQELGQLCCGLGTYVNAIRRSEPANMDGPIKIYSPSSLHELLPQTDILFITLPHTDETKHMIAKKELALLPKGAVLVNVARGPIIDEKALFEAVAEGRISAGLDVWYQYPQSEEERLHTLPSNYPFSDLDNVVMTPHLAGHSAESELMRAKELAILLNAVANGDSIPNRVNVGEGY